MGDFNKCSLEGVLNFQQYIDCPTRHQKTLDLCYGSIPDAYRSFSRPPIGCADHNAVSLQPCYKPVLQRARPVIRSFQRWTDDNILQLQDCFDRTEWDIFKTSCVDSDELADVVSSYIHFCEESVIPRKNVRIYSNNKPWVTKSLKHVLNEKKLFFYQGTDLEKRQVNKEVKREIRRAKMKYKASVEEKFIKGNIQSAWKGIQAMAGSKNKESIGITLTESRIEKGEIANEFNVFLGDLIHTILMTWVGIFILVWKQRNICKLIKPMFWGFCKPPNKIKSLGLIKSVGEFWGAVLISSVISVISFFRPHWNYREYPQCGKNPLLYRFLKRPMPDKWTILDQFL